MTPLLDPVWMAPLWKPERPFCLSRVQAVFGPGVVPGTPASAPITCQVVIAPDPAEVLNAGYFTIAEVVIANPVTEPTAVAEVEWPFGPRMIPAGWWVACCHDRAAHYTNTDEVEATLTVTLHGTNL